MSHSYIHYKNKTLRIHDSNLGLLCGIIAREISDLPQQSNMRKDLLPLLNMIVDNVYYCGYTTVVELDSVVQNMNDKYILISFVQTVIVKLSQFGKDIPKEYLASLLSAEHYKVETWEANEIIEPLEELAKMLSDA
jgi:hypothetical protein